MRLIPSVFASRLAERLRQRRSRRRADAGIIIPDSDVPPDPETAAGLYGWALLPPRAGARAKLTAVVDRRAWLLSPEPQGRASPGETADSGVPTRDRQTPSGGPAGARSPDHASPGARRSLSGGCGLPALDAWLSGGIYSSLMGRVSAVASVTVPGLKRFSKVAQRRADMTVVSLDGRPMLGSHPFLEEGRLMVCCPSQAPLAPPDTSLALSPVLGSMIAHSVRGGVLPISVQETLSLERAGLATEAGAVGYDPWGEFEEEIAKNCCGLLPTVRSFDDADSVEMSTDEDEERGGARADIRSR